MAVMITWGLTPVVKESCFYLVSDAAMPGEERARALRSL